MDLRKTIFFMNRFIVICHGFIFGGLSSVLVVDPQCGNDLYDWCIFYLNSGFMKCQVMIVSGGCYYQISSLLSF